jgi:hypothetical protein
MFQQCSTISFLVDTSDHATPLPLLKVEMLHFNDQYHFFFLLLALSVIYHQQGLQCQRFILSSVLWGVNDSARQGEG